ncbi:MAG: RNA polymerase sigma factor [Lentisphaeria bacterium]|nr:RNA polymerase sigma factor [Lentisphaeria bacterium]
MINDYEFVNMLEEYRNEFFRYIYRIVWNDSVAEDVFSSAVQTAWQSREKFKPGSNFRAWMYRIITNKCYVANREIKRNSLDVDELDESHFAVDPDLEKRMTDDPEWITEHAGDELLEAMKQLSTAERSSLILLAIERYSYKEIAEILEMPVGTVMTHLSRGRTRLRRLLMDHVLNTGLIDLKNKHVQKHINQQLKQG